MMAEKLICQNKKAFHNYFIEETYQAGISLLGSEVKSLRDGKVNLGDSYGDIKRGEVFLVDAHISPYPQANRLNHDPLRTRKLLLHKREIKRLIGKVEQRGYTLIPLRLYFVNGKVKVDLGLAKGKKLFDKTGDSEEENDGTRDGKGAKRVRRGSLTAGLHTEVPLAR